MVPVVISRNKAAMGSSILRLLCALLLSVISTAGNHAWAKDPTPAQTPDKKIRAALDSAGDFKFGEKPLGEFAEYLRDIYGINVHLDLKEFPVAGVNA